MPRLPLHVKTKTGPELRMLAQTKLIGVTFVKTGRKRMAAFAIQKMRQDLDHFGRSSVRGQPGAAQEKDYGQQFWQMHAATIREGGVFGKARFVEATEKGRG